jgi:Xaa-Pro aminopeptidase
VTARRERLYDQSRLAQILTGAGLDAVIARAGQNVAYLSGMRFPGTLGRLQDFAHSPRGAIVVQFPDASATLIVSRIAAPLARRTTWLDDLREFTEYADDPYRLAAAVVRDHGVAHGRIGVERSMLTATSRETLDVALPGAELIDCTGLLDRLRQRKTDAEVAIMRNAAHAQDAAHLDVFRRARPGDTERELHARMLEALTLQGADSAHGMMQSSRNPITYGGESELPVESGDLVRTDYVSYHEGYAANLSRMAVMGDASSDQEEMYALLLRVHRETIANALRPGVRASEVYAFVRDRFVAAGFPSVASLVGHGIGVWWHQEEPMLIPTEEQALEAGMVVCLEPILDGYWHVQDEVVITEAGSELVSDGFQTDELFRLGM